MQAPTSTRWLELPNDILRSVFECLTFVDFHRAKIVCRNWYTCSKQTLPKQNTSPWLIMFPQDDGDSCALYNAEEARVYKNKRDFSKIRFLANSGNWFLVLDLKSNLYIIDLFSEKTIRLPPIESIKAHHFHLRRVGDNTFHHMEFLSPITLYANQLRGLLWVDEKKEEYAVVWYFTTSDKHLGFCKNGEDRYREIPTRAGVSDMVLRDGDALYVFTTCGYIRKIDLSGQGCFEDVTNKNINDMSLPFVLPWRGFKRTNDAERSVNIALTRSGEVLFVMSIFYESTRRRIFRLYKQDPSSHIFEVESLGDEAVLLDLGVTVAANVTLGIEPNSIYFTRHDRVCYEKRRSCPDICVYNLATKILKRSFTGLSKSRRLKDAQWFLPS